MTQEYLFKVNCSKLNNSELVFKQFAKPQRNSELNNHLNHLSIARSLLTDHSLSAAASTVTAPPHQHFAFTPSRFSPETPAFTPNEIIILFFNLTEKYMKIIHHQFVNEMKGTER